MALLWLDGFDTYTAASDVAARYAGTTSGNIGLQTTGGRFGGGSVSPNVVSSISYLGPIQVPHSGTSAIIFGAAVNFSATAVTFLSFNNTLGNSITGTEASLQYDAGQIKLWRNYSANGTLLATSTQTYPSLNWHHIEVKIVVADSGSVEVRMNGVTVINFTGDTRHSTTGTPGLDRIYLNTAGQGTTGGMWDDVYVMDTSGGTMNDFLGDCRINTLAPTTDSSVQFTRSTGASNYLCVDEGRMNSDTDYVESSTVGHIDRYGYADLSASVTTVHAVQATTWARKTDAATRTMRNLIVSGGSTGIGSTVALTTAYAPIATPLAVVPGTGAAWTPSDVNSLTAGFEVVS